MIKKIAAFTLLVCISFSVAAQEKAVTKGMKVTRSIKIKKSVYRFESTNDSTAVIYIEGNDITIDFANATLHGGSKKQPDQFTGAAVIIRNSKNVTIKNLNVRGFKFGLIARDVQSLTLQNCNLSYNYRQHLNSTQEKEDISDWMSYHHNEKDQWMRYGAAIYLRNCQMAIVRDCKVTGGQNALMMTNCNDGLIYNNDFSFNSGIGIGMYRSSRNKVLFNRIIFNVRGYSHGVYNRGQDSAGILVYEQSNENVFYKNAATHSGDGFFLWAGQTTMDSGKGGCNDNLLMSNDFSYAPTNGIEVTFSRNKMIDNRIYECDHGIWGGYSFESVIANNRFRYNRIGIAIEHGQNNTINNNLFFQDKEAIRLWARKQQPADWGYSKNRDTKSRDYIIALNSFNEHDLVLNVNRTENLKIFGNRFTENKVDFKFDSTVSGIDSTDDDEMAVRFSTDTSIVTPYIEKPNDPFKGGGVFAGRKNIWMTEWGPYDFKYPVIYNTNPTDTSGKMIFQLKGPAGKWKIKKFAGLDSLSMIQGSFPASFTAIKKSTSITDIKIELEYSGPAFTDMFGNVQSAGKPFLFGYKKFFQPIEWKVNWFTYDSLSNPLVTGSLFPANARLMPVKTEQVNKLDYAWWGGIQVPGKSYPKFITVAEASANIERGAYELGITWDDAVRIYVDDKLVINEWNPSKYTFDESPHKVIKLELGGRHTFRVEHLELGGFATLSLKLNKL